jgi:hypothetical protein
MFKYQRAGQGPPAAFVPSSQQQQKGGRSKAIPIVAPIGDVASSDAESSQQSSSLSNTPSYPPHISPQRNNANIGQATSPYARPKRIHNSNTGRQGSSHHNTGETMSSASPAKAALSARAASAAVFVPKGVASPSLQNRQALNDYDGMEEGAGTARLMENMNITGHGGEQPGYNPYANNDSGRGTPTSLGMGGYETDGSVSHL